MTASQWIEVDGEVLAAIKDAAEPFVDNPNRVLRRLFELPALEKDGTAAFPAKIARAPRSSLLPLAEFELAILRAVADACGEATRLKLMEVLGRELDDRLTDLDREPLISGALRWQSRVDQARNRLVKAGFLESPYRGVWKLTPAGAEDLDRREAAAAERGAAK
jgi:Mrr N-terminal domain